MGGYSFFDYKYVMCRDIMELPTGQCTVNVVTRSDINSYYLWDHRLMLQI